MYTSDKIQSLPVACGIWISVPEGGWGDCDTSSDFHSTEGESAQHEISHCESESAHFLFNAIGKSLRRIYE